MTISIFNQKGGVGKTTTAVNLAAALSATGASVLLLDMDAQANASALVGARDARLTLFDALVAPDKIALRTVIWAPMRVSFHVAPGGRALAGLESALRDEPGREQLLRELLETHQGAYDYTIYDYTIIDNGPTLGLPAVMSLVAARLVIIPMQCERLAVEGLVQAFHTVETVKRRLNPHLEKRVLLTMIDARLSDGKAVAAELRDRLGGGVFETEIRVSSALKEGYPIHQVNSKGRGAQDYDALAREIAGGIA